MISIVPADNMLPFKKIRTGALGYSPDQHEKIKFRPLPAGVIGITRRHWQVRHACWLKTAANVPETTTH